MSAAVLYLNQVLSQVQWGTRAVRPLRLLRNRRIMTCPQSGLYRETRSQTDRQTTHTHTHSLKPSKQQNSTRPGWGRGRRVGTQLVKPLSCKCQDLTSDPQNTCKALCTAVCACNLSHCEMRGWTRETLEPYSQLAQLAQPMWQSSQPMRDPVPRGRWKEPWRSTSEVIL